MLALATIVLLGIVALVVQPWWTERRRAKLRAEPFPAAWRPTLRRRVPAVARLATDL